MSEQTDVPSALLQITSDTVRPSTETLMSNETPQPNSPTACREGHYPYPDECVFMVSAVQTAQIHGRPLYDSMRVVARRAEVAVSHYEAIRGVSDYGWKVVGCRSLAELKHFRDAIDAQRETATKVAEAAMARIMNRRQSWVVVYADTRAGQASISVFSAYTAAAVAAHVAASGRQLMALLAPAQIDAAIASLEEARIGEASDAEYATDYRGGEFVERMREVAGTLTPEEKEKAHRRMERVAALRAMGRLD